MKKLSLLLVIMVLAGCSGPSQKDIDGLNHKIDSISGVNESLAKTIDCLRDSISILSFPANQRMAEIKSFIESNDFTAASKGISELKKVFPKSSEAKECAELGKIIKAKQEAYKAEQERLKALGFKGIAQKNSFKIDYNTITLSGISIGTQFSFDDYGHQYFYRTADRGNKYVTAAMSVTSTNKDPKLPELAIYVVKGDKMEKEATFDTQFARWKDYGAYLGNYHDNGNDFAKVSTVRFKIGCEVSSNVTSRPFAIVCKNSNVLKSTYDRFRNPPISYSGYASYPSELTMKDFNKNYTLIKLFNL